MLPKNFSTTHDDWVTITRGAKACGMSYTSISDNAEKGRIPFRSIGGKKKVYSPWISKFKGVKMGNPKRIKNPVRQLEGESLKAFKRLQQTIEATHKDVVYDFAHDDEGILVDVYLIVAIDEHRAEKVHAKTVRLGASNGNG